MKTIIRFSLSLVLFALVGCNKPPEENQTNNDRLTIRVRTDPKGATVYLDGQKLDAVTPCQVETDNRGHMVEVSYPGHETVWHRVPVVLDTTKPYDGLNDLELKPKTVPVILDTVPPGALVSMDGQDRGTSPVFLKEVRLGKHQVNYRFKAGYAPVNINIDVREGEPQIVKKIMESILGEAKIVSRNSGSQIYIDGSFKGRIGSKGEALDVKDLEEGNHLLVAKKPGFKDLEQKFVVKRKEKALIQLPAMQQLPGAVLITSNPAGAIVIQNGQQIGKTPLKLDKVHDDSVTFKITLEGYDPEIKTVKIVPGMTKTVSVPLVRNVGSITLVSEPAGCTIFVDGKNVGVTVPSDVPNVSKRFEYTGLRAGPHVVRVERAGYSSRQRKILLQKGESIDLKTVKLKEEWRPTHILKTRNDTKVRQVRLLGRTKDGYQVEYYKGTARIAFEVQSKNIEVWTKIQ